MNILPKKKWHVRTKENIARVRRDEKQAEEEERARLERAILAQNERRISELRSKADMRVDSMFSGRMLSEPTSSEAYGKDPTVEPSGHVNFFQELEHEEKKNLGTGNKEYEAEKRKEQQEHDSKWGIQKAFAEDTNALAHKKEWYENIGSRKSTVTTAMPVFSLPKKNLKDDGSDQEKLNYEKEKKRKKHKRKRSRSSSSSSDSHSRNEKRKKKSKKKRRHLREDDSEVNTDNEKQRKLAALREERLRRERNEAVRQHELLNPQLAVAKRKQEEASKPRYNSMFNPEFAKSRR